MPKTYKKLFTAETEEELMNMSRDEASLSLNDKQKRFCEIYIKSFNVRLAAKQAGYTPQSAHVIGWKIRQNPECNRYIAWLKLRIAKDCHVSAMDIIDQYIRIAFADMTDFVTIKNGSLILKNEDMLDGQLITSIKKSRDGNISLELADKLKALERLEKYFDVMPVDWRVKIEEKKLELMEERLEIERIKAGQGIPDEDENDGFIEALKESAEEIWCDEEDVD